MSLEGTIATDGSESAVLGYLIDNEGREFDVTGGTFLNGGSGTINNPSGVKGNWGPTYASGGIPPINHANYYTTPDTGIITYPTGTVPVANFPTVGQAACIKSAGPPMVIGYCSTVVGSGGACTCN